MSLQPVSDKQLRIWFNLINRRSFQNKLAETFLEFEDSKEWIASTGRYRTLAPCRKKWEKEHSFVIRINEKIRFSRSLTVISLAHEMVHVEHWGWPHGKRFEKRVLEVIKKAKITKFI